MPRELGQLGRPVRLRPARRRGLLVPLAAALVVVAAAARGGDGQDPGIDQLVAGAAPASAAEAPAVEPPTLGAPAAGAPAVEAPAVDREDVPRAATAAAAVQPAVQLPVMGRAGGLLLHVPATTPLVVSYHEAALPQALAIQPLGRLSSNENATRPIEHAGHPDGLDFHVQVSRGRANASTSAVDVVLAASEPVRAPVSGTVTEVRPYQLYGIHDDLRLELQPDGSDLAVVLIHVRGVVVRAGDRVEVGDVLAGAARTFPFDAVVDRQTEPERHGHVHLEVKTRE